MKKKLFAAGISLAVLFFAIVLFVVLIKSKPEAKKTEKIEAPIKVHVMKVNESNTIMEVTYPGRVNSFENISLSAEVNGRIMQGNVPLKEGQYFNQGQILMQIYGKDTEASLKASKSNFLKSLSTLLPDMYVDFPESYKKWKVFFQSITLDGTLPNLPKVESENEKIYLASNGILSEYYTIQQQEINLSKYRISAPFKGYYKKVNKEVGSFAGAGTEIAQIIRSDKYEITVPVPINVAKKLSCNEKTIIRTEHKELTGTISRIAGFVDASTQSVNIYITYTPKQRNDLFEGEFVSIKLNTTNVLGGVKIPREAVMSDHTVYTIEKNKLRKTLIKEIQQLDDYTLVAGLNQGEILVMESLLNVTEGQPVELIID